jgi:GNAT superfamily N-acetyltransferase
MDIRIELATADDIDELDQLYQALLDHLESGTNYPGWKKGIYPVRLNAVNGVGANQLFVARLKGKIIGTVILNHKPEAAYKEVKWEFETDYSDVFVVHTLAVHPEYMNCSVGKKLMKFALQYGKERNMKAIRLDVYEKNLPAIKLYEQSGFHYVDTVDLGLSDYGLHWFKLYEKVLSY